MHLHNLNEMLSMIPNREKLHMLFEDAKQAGDLPDALIVPRELIPTPILEKFDRGDLPRLTWTFNATSSNPHKVPILELGMEPTLLYRDGGAMWRRVTLSQLTRDKRFCPNCGKPVRVQPENRRWLQCDWCSWSNHPTVHSLN